jgi:NDP-sugar pyrophosphorylase family protein
LQSLILAGGLGTRLREAVNDRPKSMALVNGKPFLEYQIDFLKKNGIKDIILSTGYMSEKIEEYFGSGKKHGISVRYAKEKDLLGTGGAIKNAKDMLDEQFFVLNGDSIFLIDFNKMIKFHEENKADSTLSLVKVKDKLRYGNVRIDYNFQITGFVEKENSAGELISGGIYFFEKSCFDWNVLPEKFSIEKEFFPTLVIEKRVFGFVSDSYFIDIGTVKDYAKFENHLTSGIITI